MSLNRTLERLFRAMRAEAARNPAFAAELEAALLEFRPRRGRGAPPRAAKPAPPEVKSIAVKDVAPPVPPPPANEAAPPLNPIAFMRRAGAPALREELSGEAYSEAALRALLKEHNLDPAGEAAAEGREQLVERIVAGALRRIERDQRLFAY